MCTAVAASLHYKFTVKLVSRLLPSVDYYDHSPGLIFAVSGKTATTKPKRARKQKAKRSCAHPPMTVRNKKKKPAKKMQTKQLRKPKAKKPTPKNPPKGKKKKGKSTTAKKHRAANF